MDYKELVFNAFRLHLDFAIHRYLLANSKGREDGAEKAMRHLEMCQFYVAASAGVSEDHARIWMREKVAQVHDATQALTDNLDEVINFPLDERWSGDSGMVDAFFEKFHEIALACLGEAEDGN